MEATLNGNTLTIPKEALAAAFADYMKEAGVPKPKAEPAVPPVPVAEHAESFLKGWLPSLNDAKEDAIGGFAAIATAKLISKAAPPLSSPFLADYAAWLLLHKTGVLKGSQMRAAQTVLTVDALRALLPIIDNTIDGLVASVPVLLPGAPIQLPAIGSLAPGTAAMRESASHADVVSPAGRLAFTNI